MIEGSGSIPLTNGSGSRRPKSMWIRWIRIRWIRIRHTAQNQLNPDPDWKTWPRTVKLKCFKAWVEWSGSCGARPLTSTWCGSGGWITSLAREHSEWTSSSRPSSSGAPRYLPPRGQPCRPHVCVFDYFHSFLLYNNIIISPTAFNYSCKMCL